MNIKRNIVAILTICSIFCAQTNLIGKDRFDMLLSFEGSATNWTIAILQLIAKKPVRCANPKDKFETNRLNLNLDLTKPCLYRTHRTGFLRENLHCFGKDSHLLLLLRNPKEAIPKASKTEDLYYDIASKPVTPAKKRLANYIDNLEFFDSYNGPKHILYYEDLISDPLNSIKQLLAFFGEDPNGASEFMKNYEQYKNRVVNSYVSQRTRKDGSIGGGVTAGNKLIYYSKKFSKSSLVKFDELLKNSHPTLYKKYLKRYEEPL